MYLATFYVYEILFSLQTAFLAVSVIFLFADNLAVPFMYLEASIKRALHIRLTDVITGYIYHLIASTVLAILIGVCLQVSSRTRFTKWIIRSASGVILLLSPPIFWFCYYQKFGWPFGWPYRWAPLELGAALFCLILYLRKRWRVPGWIGMVLIVAHYFFWYWIPSSNPEAASYRGPIGPILGFCAAMAWVAYIARLQSNSNP